MMTPNMVTDLCDPILLLQDLGQCLACIRQSTVIGKMHECNLIWIRKTKAKDRIQVFDKGYSFGHYLKELDKL